MSSVVSHIVNDILYMIGLYVLFYVADAGFGDVGG